MDIKDLWCIEAQAHGTSVDGWTYSRQVPRFYVFAESHTAAQSEALRLLDTVSPINDYTLVVVARWATMIPAPLSQPG